MRQAITTLLLLAAALSGADRDIRDYGAACNGSTNDTAAVRAAIAALQDGDTLTFSCQAYIGAVDSAWPLRISGKQNITVRGINGGGYKVKERPNDAVAGEVFQIDNCTDPRVEHLNIDGNNIPATPLVVEFCTRPKVTYNTVTRVGCNASQCAWAGLGGIGNVDGEITHNSLSNFQVYWASATQIGDNARGMWWGNGLSGPNNDNGDYIAYNTFANIGGTAIVAMGTNFTIEHNSGTGLYFSGVKTVAGGGSWGVTHIEHNNFTGSYNRYFSGGGVQLGSEMAHTEANYIRYNTIIGTTHEAIALVHEPDSYTEIANNTVRESSIALQFVQGSWSNVLVKDNDFAKGTGSPPWTVWHAVRMLGGNPYWDASLTNITFQHNRFDGFNHEAVVLWANGNSGSYVIDEITFLDNVFTNNGTALYINELNGASNKIQDVYLSGNCFAGNNDTLFDNRANPISPDPAQSGSCPWDVGDVVTITTTSLPSGTIGFPYSQALSATGGTPPYSWSVIAGSLPGGLELSAGGTISGTPAAAGTFEFTVRATDAAAASDTQILSIVVTKAPGDTSAKVKGKGQIKGKGKAGGSSGGN